VADPSLVKLSEPRANVFEQRSDTFAKFIGRLWLGKT
jgi:hypothetical protein